MDHLVAGRGGAAAARRCGRPRRRRLRRPLVGRRAQRDARASPAVTPSLGLDRRVARRARRPAAHATASRPSTSTSDPTDHARRGALRGAPRRSPERTTTMARAPELVRRPRHAEGRRPRAHDLPPRRAAVEVRRRAAAVQPQGPAREPAAHRGQRLGRRRPTSRRSRRWDAKAEPSKEIAFTPARVVMQDFTGVPAVVDLAAMRDAMADLGGDPAQDQPARPRRARHRPLGAGRRVRHPRRVPRQRRARVRAQPGALRVPALGPGRVRRTSRSCRPTPASSTRSTSSTSRASSSSTTRPARAYPDTLVGTDSHTTMINGLGVLGWGVGGIEAEAAMLGQPMSMLIPQVIGFKLARRAARGRDRDRPRADRHRDAAQEGRRRQVRRVLRPGRLARCRWPTARRSAT